MRFKSWKYLHTGLTTFGLVSLALSSGTWAASTERVSVSSAGVEGNGYTGPAALSSDGRYVVFQSSATNLVSNDTNGVDDIFVRDRVLGTTSRINLGSGGVQANATSSNPTLSRDGRYIAYESAATNLVSTANNGLYHVFRYDMLSGTTTHVSKSTSGTQGNGSSMLPAISNDGRFISFTSHATNLVTGDTNARPDVFRRDVTSNITLRVNVTNGGAQGNNTEVNENNASSDISGDGRYILFRSNASNLVTGDTNGTHDLFIRDATSNTTQRVSLTTSGAQANGMSNMGAISADGRYVAFSSTASNLVSGDTNIAEDVFVRDRTLNTTTRISVSSSGAQTPTGALGSTSPSISDNGRFVAFTSYAANLVSGDTNNVSDIFVRDRTNNTTVRESVSTAGVEGNDYSHKGKISANGQYVAFVTGSSNLVSGDNNGTNDAFVRVR